MAHLYVFISVEDQARAGRIDLYFKINVVFARVSTEMLSMIAESVQTKHVTIRLILENKLENWTCTLMKFVWCRVTYLCIEAPRIRERFVGICSESLHYAGNESFHDIRPTFLTFFIQVSGAWCCTGIHIIIYVVHLP